LRFHNLVIINKCDEVDTMCNLDDRSVSGE